MKKNPAKLDLKSIIDTHFNNSVKPCNKEWKRLINLYPEHRVEIIDYVTTKQSEFIESLIEDTETDTIHYENTISSVLDKVRSHSNSLNLAKKKIDELKGPSVRNLTINLGFNKNRVNLINGVLSGRIIAPQFLISKLSQILEIPSSSLSRIFHLNFEDKKIPAFKATGNKPTVPTTRISWEDAVNNIANTSPAERAILLGHTNN